MLEYMHMDNILFNAHHGAVNKGQCFYLPLGMYKWHPIDNIWDLHDDVA